MSEINRFYEPNEVDYLGVATVYQEAFKGYPWYEVSKCADSELKKRCSSGFSRLALGEMCLTCSARTTEPAYNTEELVAGFIKTAETRPSKWYQETIDGGLALAAITWTIKPAELAAEKYADNPDMDAWLSQVFPGSKEEIAWLDEIFADKSVRQSGNLSNFEQVCQGFMDNLNVSTLAFRTINPALTRATERDFGELAKVYKREVDVPDRRDFVVISKAGLK